MTSRLMLCLLAALPACAADVEAPALLAKAVAAFQHNLENEKHWNWTISETRYLADKSGKSVETFPAVHSESVIQGDGRRCNAVTSWGDGHQPYLKDANSDACDVEYARLQGNAHPILQAVSRAQG